MIPQSFKGFVSIGSGTNPKPNHTNMPTYTSRALAPTNDEPKLELVTRSAPDRGTAEYSQYITELKAAQEARFAKEGVPPRIPVFSNTLEGLLRGSEYLFDKEETASINAFSLADQYGFRDESFDDAFTGKQPETSIFSPKRFNYLLDYNTDSDPNTMLGNRWLCRGKSFIVISQSGVGKSSLTAQLAIGWSIARPELTFGIPAIKPLRQLIVQAENDDGDIAEVAQGIAQGFGLTPAERHGVNSLVEWCEVVGSSGEQFLDHLETELFARHARGEAIDVCWIDPLLSFIGGDISRADDVKAFTSRLDVIGQELGTIFGIVHHTGKPAKDEREITATDLAYAGIGSSTLTNWAREVVVVKREHTAEGEAPTFSLTMCKRRKRAGLATMAPEGEGGSGMPTESIFIRHASDGTIRWEQCSKPSNGGGNQSSGSAYKRGKSEGKAGRPSAIHTDAQRLDIADAVKANGGNPRLPAPARLQLATMIGVNEKTLKKHLDDMAEKNEAARAELKREGIISAPTPEEQEADSITDTITDKLDAFEE